MIDPTDLPASVQTILVTRLDALGDIVLGSMLLSGLHAKWPQATVQLVVRPQMTGVAALLPEWVQVLALPFDPREPIGTLAGEIVEQLREFAAHGERRIWRSWQNTTGRGPANWSRRFAVRRRCWRLTGRVG